MFVVLLKYVKPVSEIDRLIGGGLALGVLGTANVHLERTAAYPTEPSGAALCPGGAEIPAGSGCFHDAYGVPPGSSSADAAEGFIFIADRSGDAIVVCRCSRSASRCR